MERTEHTIDATDQILGRLATRVAIFLMGKHKVDYSPEKDLGDKVLVTNISKLKLNKKKIASKIYYTHSSYPGGLREMSAKNVPPQKMLRQAIYTMLPKNKLRANMLKRLTIQ